MTETKVDSTTAAFFAESRQAARAGAPDPKCLICGQQRSTQDKKGILSHLMPRSVLRERQNDFYCADVSTGQVLGYTQLGFRGYCSTCELALSNHGEVSFNPKLHSKLVANFAGRVEVDDPKVFHCLLSIGWRGLALSDLASAETEAGKAARAWLCASRAFLQTGDVTRLPQVDIQLLVLCPDQVCGLLLRPHFVGADHLHVQATVVAPVYSFELPKTSAEGLMFPVHIGPLHMQMWTFAPPEDLLAAIRSIRVPPIGKFVIPAGNERAPLAEPVLQGLQKHAEYVLQTAPPAKKPPVAPKSAIASKEDSKGGSKDENNGGSKGDSKGDSKGESTAGLSADLFADRAVHVTATTHLYFFPPLLAQIDHNANSFQLIKFHVWKQLALPAFLFQIVVPDGSRYLFSRIRSDFDLLVRCVCGIKSNKDLVMWLQGSIRPTTGKASLRWHPRALEVFCGKTGKVGVPLLEDLERCVTDWFVSLEIDMTPLSYFCPAY
jgi:hypothetical protein